MPETLDDILTEAAGGEPVPEPTEPEPEAITESEPETITESEPENKPEETKPTEKKSNPIKEIREALTAEKESKKKMDTTLQRYLDGNYSFKFKDFRTEDGKIDYDSIISAMDEEDTKKRAEERGIDPKVQQEIERIEREKQELQRERLQVSMDRALATLQTEQNLKDEDINRFFKDAMAVKKNPYQWLAQGGSLGDLYYLINKDSITNKRIEEAVAEARSKWESANKVKAPTANPAATKTSSTISDGMSLDALLSAALNK